MGNSRAGAGGGTTLREAGQGSAAKPAQGDDPDDPGAVTTKGGPRSHRPTPPRSRRKPRLSPADRKARRRRRVRRLLITSAIIGAGLVAGLIAGMISGVA